MIYMYLRKLYFEIVAKQDAEPPPESENCDLDLSGIDDDEIDGVRNFIYISDQEKRLNWLSYIITELENGAYRDLLTILKRLLRGYS